MAHCLSDRELSDASGICVKPLISFPLMAMQDHDMAVFGNTGCVYVHPSAPDVSEV